MIVKEERRSETTARVDDSENIFNRANDTKKILKVNQEISKIKKPL